MSSKLTRFFVRAGAAFLLTALGVVRVAAIDVGPVSFHGAVSATASFSDRYNYLGHTADTVSINTTEVVVNGNYSLPRGFRFAAQIYAYKIDSFNEVALDYAALDYAFKDYLNLRVGRVKRPAGLYGDTQDIDLVRPFAYLPLDFYQKGLRPITSSFDGAAAFGSLPLRKLGSVDYLLGYGQVPGPDSASPYMIGAAEAAPSSLDSGRSKSPALWIFWNTPVQGLRFGYSESRFDDITSTGKMKSAAELALAPNDYRLSPMALPAGIWNKLIAGKTATYQTNFIRKMYSADYTRGNWQFSLEYLLSSKDTNVALPAPLPKSHTFRESESYYGMVTWQAHSRLQLGAYYGEGFLRKDDRDGDLVKSVPKHTTYLKDLCFAGSYNLAAWWLVKIETHFLDGTKGILAEANGDAKLWQPRWNYVVFKSTVSF